jgi:hypothetical protein
LHGRVAAGVVIALIVVVVAVGYVTVIRGESRSVQVFVLLIAVAALLATSVLRVPSRHTSAANKVVVAEGRAIAGDQVAASATEVVISGVTFALPGADAADAFEDESTYRVYYLRPATGPPVLLSAERA